MNKMVEIEVQDQFGHWHHLRRVNDNPATIMLALQAAIQTQLASRSRKARAVDADTGQLIDILFG